MNTPHTPGPWKLAPMQTAGGWELVVDQHGGIVANVNSETGPDIPPLVSRKMPAEANARLIAAAPELLAALATYGIREHFDCEDSHYSCPKIKSPGAACTCGADDHNYRVRQIIAKAKGGEA